jgi:hypothetical protein
VLFGCQFVVISSCIEYSGSILCGRDVHSE